MSSDVSRDSCGPGNEYYLADVEIEQVGVCVLIKTKKPKIRWHFGWRSPEDVIEYLQKFDTVTSAIRAGLF